MMNQHSIRLNLLIFLSIFFFSFFSQAEETNQNNLSSECSEKDFLIERVVVFQSVEAPQLNEPARNLYRDIPLSYYDNYDLVRGKTAVVLVDIYNNKEEDNQSNKEFSLSLNIYDDNLVSEHSICLESVEATPLRSNLVDVKFCSFTRKVVKERFQKLLLIPEDLKTGRNFTAEVQLKSSGKVCSKKSFSFRVHNTRALTLGFSGVDASKCQPDLVTDYEKMIRIEQSEEATSYIPNMFPVSDYLASLTANEQYFFHPEAFSWLKADCKKESLLFGVSGMIQDIRKAMVKRNKIGVEKLALIVPDGYFQYHGHKNALGLVLRNVKKYKVFGFRFGSVPAHHIAFVNERYDSFREMENKGVLSHELGHTLNQRVEFYEKDTNNDDIADSYEYCEEIWGDSNHSCLEYKIPRAFSNVENHRGIIFNKNTIMSDTDFFSLNWMLEKWIDWDTYQKSFSYLKKPDTDQEESLQWIDRLFGARQDIVTFSGLYVPKTEAFITVPDEYYPTVEGSRGGFATEDSEYGDLLIEYKKGDQLISQRKFVSELEISILTDDGSGRTENLDLVPIVVSLPVNGYYGNEDNELIVSLIDKEGNKLKELFREYVYRWER